MRNLVTNTLASFTESAMCVNRLCFCAPVHFRKASLYETSLVKRLNVQDRLTRSLARDRTVCSTAGLEVQTKSSQ
ncbi:hypothetical protein COCSUDRAFT_33127 [Coccomyxa subellipsoidea C-169]|uniref:Uncharacterized protein n=1 Tax=Coccomyxa subellipsoidea (strain C-169) TaxID=574566 RepID=I0YYW3_COCSC|nr:hypothetical protein COCSUDRAFT_33127 [Coccomyxa subellipsoidea C-169]EIE23582.1 hypothetical protein COCSUDRAFT_33127 [Coccomyxa subellipsoidea C-169]|eukprot:XP_005648126.1 hypothetical protein COCSUDRAFT_33127 [Coccomyxa subellipsoidea C-169]